MAMPIPSGYSSDLTDAEWGLLVRLAGVTT